MVETKVILVFPSRTGRLGGFPCASNVLFNIERILIEVGH